jgi:glycosyltransferase involved in cell wall biosynthesis
VSSGAYDVVFYVPSITPLLVAHAAPPAGGAETQIVLLTQALSAMGLRVAVVAFQPETEDLPHRVGDVDVIGRRAYRAHQPLLGKIREALRIHQTLRCIDAKTVVTRVAGAQVGLVGVSARLLRRRFIYSSANISDFGFAPLAPKRRDLALFQLGVRLADTVVVQTEEQLEMCEATFEKTAVVVPSIAEPVGAPPVTPEALLWIGRLVWYKRPLEFVELARALPDIPFRMVGVPSASEPALAAEVEAAAADVPNLEIATPRPRASLMRLIERAAAIVNTADFEGMPNIFLEGWSRGIPALALTHDPGGVIERHAVGVYAHESREQLITGARRLWDERGSSVVATRCREFVATHHSPEAVAASWLRVLVGPAGSPSRTLVEAAEAR